MHALNIYYKKDPLLECMPWKYEIPAGLANILIIKYVDPLSKDHLSDWS